MHRCRCGHVATHSPPSSSCCHRRCESSSQEWRANDFRFRGKLDWRYYRRSKTSSLTREEKDVQDDAVRRIDAGMKERFKALRMDEKYDATSNTRVKRIALVGAICDYIDAEVYNEVREVRVSLS
jgi:hypothetical protein